MEMLTKMKPIVLAPDAFVERMPSWLVMGFGRLWDRFDFEANDGRIPRDLDVLEINGRMLTDKIEGTEFKAESYWTNLELVKKDKFDHVVSLVLRLKPGGLFFVHMPPAGGMRTTKNPEGPAEDTMVVRTNSEISLIVIVAVGCVMREVGVLFESPICSLATKTKMFKQFQRTIWPDTSPSLWFMPGFL